MTNKEIKKEIKEQTKEIEKAEKKYMTKFKFENPIMLNHLRGESTKLRHNVFDDYNRIAQEVQTLKKTDYSILSDKDIDKLRAELKSMDKEIVEKYHTLNDLDARNKVLYDLIALKTGKKYNFSNAHDIIECAIDLMKDIKKV